jgi:hypothetical protein
MEDEVESEKIAEHVEKKGLHSLLEATLDPRPTEEFGDGASIYFDGVDVIASRTDDGQLRFAVLHPADDRDRCDPDEPSAIVVPWEFDALGVSKRLRKMAKEATRIYAELGIDPLEFVGGMD